MFLIREIMHCKPGKANELVRRFKEFAPLFQEQSGVHGYRVMTDFSGERYWTVISETEVEDLGQHLERGRQAMNDPRFQKIMQGYHDFVEWGRREIYRLET